MKKLLLLFIVCALAISHLFAQTPTITSFSPTNGPIGTSVTIVGTNFDTTPANNIVFIGATQAIVTAGTTTSLTVTVPVGATYQPITVLSNGLLAYSSLSFLTTFAAGGAIDATSFAPKVDFTTGTNPYSVSIGDLDGDGKADLAVANRNDNTVSVFRNTGSAGSISYAAKVDFISGLFPSSVSIGDVDGDGKGDLVVANNTSNTVSVFRNTGSVGSISYAAKVDFTTGSGPFSVSIGDLDEDGKADLAVVNRISYTVSVFRNTGNVGNISYAAKVDFVTGIAPSSVSIGDLDGDGKADMAVTNQGSSSTVSVFRNTGSVGSISFATKVDFTTGSGAYSVSIGDLDGDGKADLAVVNFISNTVSVILNTGTVGSISYAAKVDFATGGNPNSVSIGDLDGDGKPDLAVASPGGSDIVSVFRNMGSVGSISYAAKVDFTTGTGSGSVSVGDLDGDGKADLMVTNFNSNTVSVFRNTVSAYIPTPTITNFTPASGLIGTTVTITGTNFDPIPSNNTVKFNGTVATVTASTSTSITTSVPSGATTGTISVTVGGNTATSTSNFTVISIPPITFAPKVDYPVGTSPREVEVADFNGDGHLDIATSNSGSSSISVLYGTGTGCFGTAQNFPGDPYILGLAVGDLNGDGKPDLVGANRFPSNTISVFINSGTGFLPKVDYASGGGDITLTIRDINNDNSPDLLAVDDDQPNGDIAIFINTGLGTFNPKVEIATDYFPYFVDAGDVDHDGLVDMVVANPFSNTITVYKNSGSGFTAQTPFNTGYFTNYVIFSDLNKDTFPDIVCANAGVGNSIGIFINDGLGNYSAMTALPTLASGGTPNGLSATDFNNDGNVDIVAISPASAKASVFLGDGTGAFATAQLFTAGNNSFDVTVGDVDEDGVPDIISANYGGNSVSVLLTSSNTCGSLPTITSFTPSNGPVGTILTITGTVFNTIPANNNVYFNGTAAVVTASTATSITTSVPSGATTGTISVTIGGNTATSATAFTVTAPLPTIISFSPTSGTVGTSVILTGTNFDSTPANNTVKFNGAVTVVTASTSTSITTTVPANATTGIVSVTIGLNTANSPTPFCVIPPPPVLVSAPQVCSGTASTITVSGGSNGQYRWYTVASGGAAISGQTNSIFTTPTISTATTYYVSLNNGTCESARTSVLADVKVCPKAPEFATTQASASIGGQVAVSLITQITTFDTPLDLSSIQITSQPASGAKATIVAGVLNLDYSGISFSGVDVLSVKACDMTPTCTTGDIKIDVAGDITIFNAVSSNGDNKNDIFYIQYIDVIPETKNNRVTIFNRWGDNVFETDNYDNVGRVFRGQSTSGNELPSGVYFYKIDFAGGSPTRTGYLSLKR